LYSFFCVIPRRLTFMCRRFGTLGLFHLHRLPWLHHRWRWKRQSIPKRRHIKFRRQGITKKKEYNIQDTAKVLNQEYMEEFVKVCKNLQIYKYIINIFNLLISSKRARPRTFQNYLNACQLLLFHVEFMFCWALSVNTAMWEHIFTTINLKL